MNERIRELVEQAGGHFGKGLEFAVVFGELDDFKKFAELIVRECAKAAYLYSSDSENYKHYDDIGWDCLPGDLQSHIKEHFGVDSA
jgi:hypothetical protein